jgi:murein DD-endopeptidase MepM/ murein hydrolase activator NlpD
MGVGWRAIRETYKRVYPRRELYYRSQGRVHYFVLSGALQAALTLALVLPVGWVAFATTHYIVRVELLAAKDDRIAEIQLAYDNRSRELEEMRVRFIAVASDLAAKHRQLVALIQQKTALEQRLGSLDNRLESVTGERDDARNQGERLRETLRAQRDALNDQIGVLEGALDTTLDERTGIQTALNDTRKRLGFVTGERNALIDSRQSIASQLELVVQDLNDVRREQREFVARVLARTENDLNDLEGTIALTGLDIEDLLVSWTEGNRRGQGGLFIRSAEELGLLDGDAQEKVAFENAVAQLELRLARWEGVQDILQALPLAAPAGNYYVSSKYGRRRDPITKRWAFHAGVDMAGPPRTAIRATAPGVVTFVGTRGPFGRTVEVQHGYGIKTRYAHLRQILVHNGEEVSFRQKIGVMGSTGRSTGTHLHYAILLNGSPLDPAEFLKAGQYVFKK